jgi:hypothetical protein
MDKKIKPKHNTDGIINKLVMVFAFALVLYKVTLTLIYRDPANVLN